MKEKLTKIYNIIIPLILIIVIILVVFNRRGVSEMVDNIIHFNVPKSLNTEMLDTGLINIATEDIIIDKINNSSLNEVLEIMDKCYISTIYTEIDDVVYSDPEKFQTRDREKTSDEYRYFFEIPMKLTIVYTNIDNSHEQYFPFDITVSGMMTFRDYTTYTISIFGVDYCEDLENLFILVESLSE